MVNFNHYNSETKPCDLERERERERNFRIKMVINLQTMQLR